MRQERRKEAQPVGSPCGLAARIVFGRDAERDAPGEISREWIGRYGRSDTGVAGWAQGGVLEVHGRGSDSCGNSEQTGDAHRHRRPHQWNICTVWG